MLEADADGGRGDGAPSSATGAEPVAGGGTALIRIAAYSKSAATKMSATPVKVASTLPPPPLRTDRSHRLAPQFRRYRLHAHDCIRW